MPRTPYIESSLSALQNWGGYLRVSVLDNPSDKIFRALSWLFAAASAFVYIINHLACSARGLRIANGPPPTRPLSPSEAHRNLIGTSSEPHQLTTEETLRETDTLGITWFTPPPIRTLKRRNN